jgi:chromosome segregation ATPase
MSRLTIKALQADLKKCSEECDRLRKSENAERDKRYSIEQDRTQLKEEVQQLKESLSNAEMVTEHWKKQLAQCQGHLTGMRETLLAAGLLKNVDLNFIDYDREAPPMPAHKKLWPEFQR